MKQRKISLYIFLCSFLFTGFLFAQDLQRSGVILEYFDDPSQIEILDIDGFAINDVYIGMQLLAGESIKTNNTSAELRVAPNGSILKVAPNTNFVINQLPNSTSSNHEFTTQSGKMRFVAAKGANYLFRTPTASCGVRGTDFVIEIDSAAATRLVVQEGAVEFTRSSDNTSILTSAGEALKSDAAELIPQRLTTAELAQTFESLDFSKLSPATVPNYLETENTEINEDTNSVDQQNQAKAPASSPVVNTPIPNIPDNQDNQAESQDTTNTDSVINDLILDGIKKYLGLEIGSMTVGTESYGKLVFQPHIDLGDFKIGLYLPIIYGSDLFNPETWYKPGGNDEWSFGTDKEEPLDIALDIIQDTVLKIKYIELFDRGDPFFIKLGSIPSMTLGHGLLIGSFANDADFPAVRRLGTNLGLDLGGFTWEILANDLSAPTILGTRISVRPLYPNFKLGVGLSFAADLDPLSGIEDMEIDTATAEEAQTLDPYIFGFGADIDLPIFETDAFSMLFYTDFGGFMPYLNSELTRDDGSTISAGLMVDNMFVLGDSAENLIQLRNYGFMSGFSGNVLFVDYQLEFQSFNGYFNRSYFDNNYERLRVSKTLDLIDFLKESDTSIYDYQKYGIYGKAGFNILDLVTVSAAYTWPWTVGEGSLLDFVDQYNDDEFSISVDLNEDMIPFGIDGQLKFVRSHFRDLFVEDSGYSFFDLYATFLGEVSIPVGPLFSIKITLGTSLARDASGALIYEDGNPVVSPVFVMETVF